MKNLYVYCYGSFGLSWPTSDTFARESLQIKSSYRFLKVWHLCRRQTSKLVPLWRKGRRGRWTVLLDPRESTQDALTTGKALFSSCPLLALDNQPQNRESQETRQHNFYCSQKYLFLAQEIQVVPLFEWTQGYLSTAAAPGCQLSWTPGRACPISALCPCTCLSLCLQPVLSDICNLFPPAGEWDFAELAVPWAINGYFYCFRTFCSSASSGSCSDPPCNLCHLSLWLGCSATPGMTHCPAISQLLALCGCRSCSKPAWRQTTGKNNRASPASGVDLQPLWVTLQFHNKATL